ncbi:ABC transporter permease [Flavivirga algicola]|uniref:FtsX-like permease family protein n=1 Tax=Flavivirga algicola TaxID=2729136 RepID=A0ABX1S1J8_9FLAO|nr:ABC transporter permease [Flavivirga algicola]NMH88903.1 FtsX-like permease family protein [Flavivirga algicola]
MIRNYFKIAWRNIVKRKVFAAINILGLAIGFGSSILIYLFLNYNLSFDNFHNEIDRIHRITTEEHRGNDVEYSTSVPPAFAKIFKEDYSYAEKVAKIVLQDGFIIDFNASGTEKKLKQDIAFVEEDFFKIFNFPLLNGSNNVSLSAPNTAIVTEEMAVKMYGDTDVVGKTFVLENDKTIKITGVLKSLPKTSFLKSELFVSFQNLTDFFEFAAGENWNGITDNLQCFALLYPKQSIAKIETTLLELPKKHRASSKNRHVYKLQPMSDVHFNPDYGGINPTLLWAFAIIGMFLIVIASINFINISTAQAFYRSKEIGIRKVLGSFKRDLFWQFLSETFIISSFALIVGLLFAYLFLPSFNSLFEIQLTFEGLWSIRFTGFIILILFIVSFLSGSYPGILISKIVPVLALKGKLSHNVRGSTNTRKVLVVIQFTVSIVLIASTIIMSKQIDYSINADLGFDKESIVMVTIPRGIDDEKFYSLKGRLEQISGVEHVSGCLSSPGASENIWTTNIKFHTRSEDEEFNVSSKLGDEDYIKTFNIELVAGRNFIKRDIIDEVLVNEKLSEKLGLSAEDMLNKQIYLNGGNIKANIVGVVKNFHDENFTKAISPVFIAPNTIAYGEIGLKINHNGINNTLSLINEKWSETFKGNIFEYRFLDEHVAEQYEREQRYLNLSKVFSGLAILIGCLGVYGLILFFVNQRIKEIGVRKVLGSSVRSILTLFSYDFIKLILIAGVIATPIAWYITEQWLREYAFRTDIKLWYFIIAIVCIMLITFVTMSYQTIKAAIANPIKSLRTE